MAMTDAYGDAADYRARTGPPLAGQAADGLPGTPWLLAPRRPLDKLDLFRLS